MLISSINIFDETKNPCNQNEMVWPFIHHLCASVCIFITSVSTHPSQEQYSCSEGWLQQCPLNPLCGLARACEELKFCPLLLVKPLLVKALMRAGGTLRLIVPRQWYRFPPQKNNWKGCHKFVHCHWVAIISLLIAIIVIEYSMLSIAKGALIKGQRQSSCLRDCDPVLSHC